MKSYKQYLEEEYLTSVKPPEYMSKHKDKIVDVFINPTLPEIKEITSDYGTFRGFINNNGDVVVFSSYILHFNMREKLDKIDKDAVSFDANIYKNTIELGITDNTKDTKWYHKEEIVDHIKSSYLSKLFKFITIDYYDSAIYGPWDELEEEED